MAVDLPITEDDWLVGANGTYQDPGDPRTGRGMTGFNKTFRVSEVLALAKDTEIVVREAADLAGTLDSTKVYYIDGAIDMGSTSIEVPEGGLTLVGAGYDISVLYSTADNATLFTSPAGGYSGNLNLQYLTLYATGTAAKVFNIDNAGNFGAIEMLVVNLGTFGAPGTETTSLGTIDSYRQVFLNGCAIIRCLDGITFDGTMVGGVTIVDSILLSIGAGHTVFKAGGTLSIAGNVRSNVNAQSINATTTVFDFAPANFTRDQGFILDGARFGGDDPVPNFLASSTKALFSSCTGISNTYPGGFWSSTAAVATTLTQNVATKLLGTTVYEDLVWFSGSASNAYQSETTRVEDYRLHGNLEIQGTKGDALTLTVRVWDDSASGYVDNRTFIRTVNDIGGNAADVAFFNFETHINGLAYLDRVELWITNTSSSASVTMLVGGIMDLTRRT